jgi:hypothetical protein
MLCVSGTQSRYAEYRPPVSRRNGGYRLLQGSASRGLAGEPSRALEVLPIPSWREPERGLEAAIECVGTAECASERDLLN